MKILIFLMLLSLAFADRAQTPDQRDSAKRDSAHRQYHLMRRDPLIGKHLVDQFEDSLLIVLVKLLY